MAPAPCSRRVALVMNGPATAKAGMLDAWFDLAIAIRTAGLTPVLCSNEWFNDAPVWMARAAALGVETGGARLDPEGYSRYLHGFDAIVTGRLHSAVLAMLAGVPMLNVTKPRRVSWSAKSRNGCLGLRPTLVSGS